MVCVCVCVRACVYMCVLISIAHLVGLPEGALGGDGELGRDDHEEGDGCLAAAHGAARVGVQVGRETRVGWGLGLGLGASHVGVGGWAALGVGLGVRVTVRDRARGGT
jgi:hypothetical protein